METTAEPDVGKHWAYKCGGSLVYNNVYIVTAAACMYTNGNNENDWRVFEPKEVRVALGVDYIEFIGTVEYDIDSYGYIHKVSMLLPYPKYNIKSFHEYYYDVGLIKLRNSVEPTLKISPITLNYDEVKEQSKIILTGFGATSDAVWTQRLQALNFTIDDRAMCTEVYGEQFASHHLCAKAPLNTDSSRNDAGSGYVKYDPTGNVAPLLVGIQTGGSIRTLSGTGIPRIIIKENAYISWFNDIFITNLIP